MKSRLLILFAASLLCACKQEAPPPPAPPPPKLAAPIEREEYTGDIFDSNVINTITKAPEYAQLMPELRILKINEWEEKSKHLLHDYGTGKDIAEYGPRLAARAERERKRVLPTEPDYRLQTNELAAKLGDATAQWRLGFMYEVGRGVTKDEAKAVILYRSAAEQENAVAQWSLGLMYADGRGVAKNDTEAAKWYRRAADQGNIVAQCNLGLMYANGEGVQWDYAEAYKLFLLASAQGSVKGKKLVALIEERLTSQQRAEGQRRASDLKPASEK